MRLRLLSLLALLLLLVTPGRAQTTLLTPSEFLGYELGQRFTPHHRVVDYVRHVADASPRATFEQYGQTYEGRPLLTVTLTTPKNQAQLERLRRNNLRLAGLAEGELEGATAAIVWLSYNVHGNESVSTEAAMAALYDLANPANTETGGWLENTVVLLDPCINPDGRDRYVHWYNQTVGRFPNANPDAREHHEPWPGGRTNHYHFDLNRDWAWMSQQETQARIPHYQRWMPHIHVDFHEQGVNSPYYFAPAAEPYHAAITPWQRELQQLIGQNHMRYFDANSWLYFTRQVFDLLYPGYGDTWPIFNGAVGMTYEQGGSSRAGLGIVTAEGDTLTLADRIAHHHTTSLSTVETAAAQHDRILDQFAQYYTDARQNPGGDYRTFVVSASNDRDTFAALADHLRGQGIAFGYADRARTTRGFHYADGTTGSVSIQPGDLVVPVAQSRGNLVRVLFEPQPFVADSVTYDITAWALPYAYGVEAYALPNALAPDTDTHEPPAATVTGPERPYAYVAQWKSLDDVRFLSQVLRAGIKLRYASEPFEIDGRAYDAGTLLLTRTGNEALGDEFDTTIRAAAAALGQPLHAVATGAVSQGSDFGSGTVQYLEKPDIAVLAGPGVSSGAAGEVWHFFDQQIGYPVTLLYPDELSSIRLADYDVLVLPTGNYSSLLPEARLNALKDWVRQGGRLVALEGALSFLSGKDGFHIRRKAVPPDTSDATARRYADRVRKSVSGGVPGAIFRLELDNSHPLGYGYGTHYFTMKRGSNTYAPLSQRGSWSVGVLRPDSHVSGFVGHQAQARLQDGLVFGTQQMGRGQVIYLADNPLFRAFWHGGKLLFANAVFMVGQ